MSMTTELAQRMKAAALKAIADEGPTWFSKDQLSHPGGLALHEADAEFIALASHQNVLALVEALEAAKHKSAVDWEAAASLNVENEELKRRIAELEARTVKLPLPRRKTADDYVDDTFEPCDLAAIYNACRLECEVKFKKALAEAGVAVEGDNNANNN
ncbi:hypothetical protein M0K99_RS20000 [Citrobacter freundii]|nr:hypothetical protein [Citrobacter freundii]EJD6625123.1 hypothetical protein [Citrobacter freundii]